MNMYSNRVIDYYDITKSVYIVFVWLYKLIGYF